MAIPLIHLLCLGTAIITVIAFHKPHWRERLMFRPERILVDKEWDRLLSSALIHANWGHLGFNLLALFSFGQQIEFHYGAGLLLVIYIASVLGGSLLSLALHRHHDYAALGASGGVCGVLFAAIFLIPGTAVGLLFIPIAIPGPVFAILYLIGTFIALRRGVGNIGHDAHFGGAITGLIFAAIIAPRHCLDSPWLFLGSVVVAGAGLWILSRDPFGFSGKILPFFVPEATAPGGRHRDYDEAIQRRKRREDIDRILDKISAKGIDSLSRKERELLDRESKRRGKP